MVVVMVGGEVVVETTACPGGEERGDGSSPGALIGEVIVAVVYIFL